MTVHDGVSPEKSSEVSFANGLIGKSDSKVPIRENIRTNTPFEIETAAAAAVELVTVASEEAEVAVVVEEWRWRSVVR